jgi:hypothetical protein
LRADEFRHRRCGSDLLWRDARVGASARAASSTAPSAGDASHHAMAEAAALREPMPLRMETAALGSPPLVER